MKTLNKLAARRLLPVIPTTAPLLAVTNCKDKVDCYEKSYVTLLPSFTNGTIPFKQGGGKQELTIETSRHSSITSGGSTEWVSTMSMEVTEGTYQIAITAPSNRSEDVRGTQVIIKTPTT